MTKTSRYELVLLAVVGLASVLSGIAPASRAAFLGSQGDEWDAQKDILCDTFGTICSTSLFLMCNDKKMER